MLSVFQINLVKKYIVLSRIILIDFKFNKIFLLMYLKYYFTYLVLYMHGHEY